MPVKDTESAPAVLSDTKAPVAWPSMADPRPLEAHAQKLAGELAVRVVYTDMDGTMLGRGGSFVRDPDGSLDPEPTATLLEALGSGIDVVPATGRSLRGLLGDARILGLQTVIAEMGAVVAYDVGREVVTNLGEYPGGEEPPAAHMERAGAVRLLFESFAGRLEHHTPWSAWRDYTQLFRGLVDTGEANAVLAGHDLGWLALHDNGRLHGAYLGLEPGASHAYHLMPRGVDKGSAVALDRARRGYAREETIAIGDAIADLAMAPEVGALILVRDAVEADDALAALASEIPNVYVSPRPGNLGWCDAMRSLALTSTV
jgi:predicted mannosyl-3-phosphoglycerate phosphatase (HAD superfamily)